MKFDVLAEEFGGDVQVSYISAKNNIGIEDLLDKILLQVRCCDCLIRLISLLLFFLLYAYIHHFSRIYWICKHALKVLPLGRS